MAVTVIAVLVNWLAAVSITLKKSEYRDPKKGPCSFSKSPIAQYYKPEDCPTNYV